MPLVYDDQQKQPKSRLVYDDQPPNDGARPRKSMLKSMFGLEENDSMWAAPGEVAPQEAPYKSLERIGHAAADDPIGTLNAIPAGFNRGVTALAGLPVDTAANIIDLGGMAYGATRAAISGRPAGEFYQPADRRETFGSGENIAKHLDAATTAVGGGPATQNLSPNNPAARLLYAGAAGIPGAVTGRMALAGGAGGAASQVVAEAGGGPGAQAVAGLVGGRAVKPKAAPVVELPLDPPLTFNGPQPPLSATGAPRPPAFNALEGLAPTQPSNKAARQDDLNAQRILEGSDTAPEGSTTRNQLRKNAVELLQTEGIPLDAAQRSGSKMKEGVKRTLNDNPATAGMQARFAEKQQAAFTNSVLKKIGVNEDAATPEVMGRAQERIGKVFDDVAERNPVKYDRKLNDELAQIVKDTKRELVGPEFSVISNQIEEVFTKATEGGGAIDGKAYQNLRTSLGRVSQTPGALGHWAGEVREVLDDALQRSARKQDLMDLTTARTRYRRMKQIEGAIDTDGLGQISAAKLANSLSTKSNRRASVYGRGDTELVRLAQAGKAILPDKFPNSGTVARFMGQVSKMNTPAALLALGLAPLRVGASALMNRQGKRKAAAADEPQATNRLASLGGAQ